MAGVETRPTGFCILKGTKAETSLVYTDNDILTKTTQNNPAIIAIDAPLSLPAGRTSIEERTNTHLRECDKELRERDKILPNHAWSDAKTNQSRHQPEKKTRSQPHQSNRGLPRRCIRHPRNPQKTTRTRKTQIRLGKTRNKRTEQSNDRS